MKIQLEKIVTEGHNENSSNIDRMDTIEMLRVINNEDKRVAEAVEEVLLEIGKAVEVIYEKLFKGGRLVYCGAGTSGRLGVLDAVECPPTYGVDPEMVVALIAGGEGAFVKAVEGAEDDYTLGEKDLKGISFTNKDVLVGIAASGRTPYVIGAIAYAQSVGAPTISITCNPESEMASKADICIAPMTGPEVVAGSTRMKSGTAQKLILNMISTGVMIKLGKVYGNLMVDVKATNQKLVERTKHIVCTATGVDRKTATKTLEQCEYSAKHAILILLTGCSYEESKKALERCNGRIADVITCEADKRL